MKLAGIQSSIREHVALAPYTTWKIGGAARYFVEPSVEEIPSLLAWARAQELPVYFLGRGSNVLIADEGLPGLVILTRNSLQRIYREGDCVIAEAGVSLPKLSKFAANEGFSGYEFLIGIPGTVGGGVVMNAGLTVFSPREMMDIVEDVELISLDGVPKRATLADLHAGYRYTDLQAGDHFVTRVHFKLANEEDPDRIHRRTIDHLRDRKRKQPLSKATAGSTFKSPAGKSAGWYIENAGLKGFRLGGAMVSEKHANWIENLGQATAKDVIILIEYIRSKVLSEFNQHLELEVRCLGLARVLAND